MLSAFSDWVSSAADAVNKISDQSLDVVRKTGLIDALQNTELQATSTEATLIGEELTVKDFMTPPAAWVGSSDEWQWCIKAALNDPNTCAITPGMLKSDDDLWQEIHSLIAGLSKNGAATAVFTAPEAGVATKPTTVEPMNTMDGAYTPSADLVAFIQEHTSIYKIRSYVVPLFTSDEDYWLNLQWRLTLYRLCTNADDLLMVMQTLSKLPVCLQDIADAEKRAPENVAEANHAAAAKREAARVDNKKRDEDVGKEERRYGKQSHLADNSAYWNEMKQLHEAEQVKFSWLREMQDRAKKEMELARGNVKLLNSLVQRQEASSALGVSVSDSCKYHKVKLSRLIGDVCTAPEENTKGTVLDLESGPLFHELFQCNEDVKNVLQFYEERSQKDGSGGSLNAQALPISSSTPTTPNREATAASDACVSLSQPVETPTSTWTKAQSATSSAAEQSEAVSVSHTPVAFQKRDSEDDDNEGSFEAKLPWSMDD
ncbi:hypothetical protein ABL78_5853 [Leptomonas seymouri]|uniref:BSD domain-containing protein n=1 Tax=Leptomonas seymouri TaxID=5684 RepID=A0A0N0P4Q4_LEPSE|nr:hypothetical protein ABL78_5853 [Leptomonas seymouri]|eukprot:KPI85087.1 hypothetical protein ABL78_5853 [Leptomonas seymouri]